MTRIGLVGALISALPLSACGGDDDGARLDGLWAADRGDGCLALFRVDGDDCALGVACQLESGQVGVERHEGQCTFDGEQVAMLWDRSTCEGIVPASVADYRLEGDQLMLEFPSARVVFERRDDDGSGSGVSIYGCWDGDFLTPGDLRPLE